MPKFMIPTDYYPTGYMSVSVDPTTPTMGQITFTIENRWHVHHLERQQLERLHHDIAAKLKAAPLPARDG
jgi:hypothetical protein